jgi:hypothetical protein
MSVDAPDAGGYCNRQLPNRGGPAGEGLVGSRRVELLKARKSILLIRSLPWRAPCLPGDRSRELRLDFSNKPAPRTPGNSWPALVPLIQLSCVDSRRIELLKAREEIVV